MIVPGPATRIFPRLAADGSAERIPCKRACPPAASWDNSRSGFLPAVIICISGSDP